MAQRVAIVRRAAARNTEAGRINESERNDVEGTGEGTLGRRTLMEWIQTRIEEAHDVNADDQMDDGATKEERELAEMGISIRRRGERKWQDG